MSGVNTMSFEQSSALLNSIRKQVTGESSLAATNTSEFISAATTTLQAGYDPVLNAITQMVSRTIFSIRPYTRRFGGIQVDAEKWGAITRKLSIADKDFDDDKRFDLTDGYSVDMFKVNKPNILQTNFYGQNVFNKNYTIFKDQLDNAFKGPDEFGRFMTMVTSNVSDMIEQAHESMARMTIGNFIGGKVAKSADVIHLLTSYNSETGSNLTSTTVYAPANFPNFIKWMYAKINTLSQLMTERSQKFQINVTGKEINRHTPRERQKIYLYAPLLNEINARVLADAYHDDFLRVADTEAVNFWQSINTPDTLQVTPVAMNSDGTVEEQTAQTISKLVGVIFDEDALGYTVIHNWSATTPFNTKGGYWNVDHNFTERYWNDFTEKGIILTLD